MKKYLLITVIVILTVVALVAVVLDRAAHQTSVLENRAALVCRAIGDQLLHHIGDTRSRILPVKRMGNGVFQLEFKNAFTFVPDTLVGTIQSNIASAGLPENYTVNVYQCTSGEIVYGFQINTQYNDIVPCLGRDQPSACYTIQIAFADLSAPLISQTEMLVILAVLLCVAVLIITTRRYSSSYKEPATTNSKTINIGKCLLNYDRRSISNGFGTIELSEIEAKLLTILAQEQNKLVSRERLLKEVWEDHGVYTSRSLDMFISKLRKKFKQDSSVALINIYGKGYKLEVK